jgi:hypothetical protein
MSKKFLFLTSFVLLLSLAYNSYGDAVAPRPNPAKWLYVPATLGPNSITMTAVTALDAGNDYPVDYNFVCTNDGTKSSGWVVSPTYEATGLTPSTTYSFKVYARDSVGNADSCSLTVPATTDANSTPPVLRLDLNNSANNDDANTQTGFLPFTIENSGSEINGVAIDLGGNITSVNREDPRGSWTKYDTGGSIPGDPCYYSPRAGERIYRDFIYGISPSGVTITLWGLGVNRDCNITIWAYDAKSSGTRTAKWYANNQYIFDANFTSGSEYWPQYINQSATAYNDLYKYAFKGRATADDLGRIILTSSRDPCSPEGLPFAFVNALKVEPNWSSTFVPTKYAYHPAPVDDANGVSADVTLEWKKGAYAEKHDVYLGTSFDDVNTAFRSNPLDVLVSLNHSTTTYTPPEFLDLNTTYYWRIDEVNAAPDYTIFKGEVWSFKTSPYFVVDNFNSYANDSALRSVWEDGSTNGTSAEVSVETAIVRDGNSMKYRYKNNLSPYYSEVSADVNTARPNGLGEDPNWLGIGAKTLVLWFYGPSGNDATKPMYVKLTDGDASPHTAQVNYDGDMNDIRDESWREWNINLQDFVDNNNVDLSNVKKIIIGFGNGTQAASDGIVYFEDIRLDKRKRICRTGWVVAGDFNGDCAVDYRDLKIITDNWLADCTAPDNCGGADFEPDGDVDLFDFSDFAMQWLWYNNPPPCDEGFTIPPMPPYSSLPTNSYLPDPFRFMSGSRMTTADQWTCRRAEIAALAQEFEFGYKQDTPYSATTGSFGSNSITVTVNDNGKTISFSCSISYPSTGSAPYPAMIGMNGSSLNNSQLSSLGVAVITFPNDQIAQQINASSRGIGKFYDMYGSSHSAGALMAWAWGVDRLIDAIEKTPAANIDPNRLGVTGCSRNGKGALCAGAFCERIKLTIPQESGSGGAASWRVSDWQAAQGQNVQTLSQIVQENCWFRANFNQFSSTATKLPFDHHMIEGLCAPRALLVIENSSMEWLGNVSTWTTGNVAHKIWEALGIPDKMGYSSTGHGDHCTFPSSQQPEVTAYVQKFLVGGGTGDTNVMKTDGGVTYNESQWVNWTVPNLQ